ncbi:MAG: hypothetical protein J6N70_11745 [Oribacterium sp.]|nr:hypothetical protein [Oribacterium sp.]
MEIKAVKFRKDGFYSQPFAFGGEEVPDENSLAFTGKDICTYMEAFASLGYKPEQVTKILLTHRHTDHSRH